jgi:hypothetical protein
VHSMCEDEKMRPVKTLLGMGEGITRRMTEGRIQL